MKLIEGETKVKVYKYKSREIDRVTHIEKGELLFNGVFQGFGIIGLGINGTKQGIIFSFMGKDEKIGLNTSRLELVEVLNE